MSASEGRLHQALAELAEVQAMLEQERLERTGVEALFEELLQAMSDAFLFTDPAGRIRRSNRSAQHLLGMSEADLTGRFVEEVAGPGLPARIWDILEGGSESQTAVREIEVHRATGDRVAVSLAAAVVRDDNGKIIGAVYSLRDLSVTQKLLSDLGAAEARWHLLAQVSEDLNSGLDPRDQLDVVAGRVTEATACTCAIALVHGNMGKRWDSVFATNDPLGYRIRSELVGTRPAGAIGAVLGREEPIVAPVCAPDFPLLGGESSAGIGSACVVPLRARERTIGVMLLASEQQSRVGGSVVEVAVQVASKVAIAIDRGDLHHEVSRLEAVQEGDRLRGELFSAVTHETLTPLSAVRSIARALVEEASSESDHELAQALTRQSDRLYALVQDFLDFNRLEEGRPPSVEMRPLDLRAPLSKGVAAFAQNREIDVAIPDDLPEVFADADRIQQIVGNLVSNAVRYSPPDSPVSVSAQVAGRYVEVSVSDRGSGMRPEELARVFERFYRGSQEGKTSGTGMGLYVSKALAESMGGRIWAQSKPREGTTFTISLPTAGLRKEERA